MGDIHGDGDRDGVVDGDAAAIGQHELAGLGEGELPGGQGLADDSHVRCAVPDCALLLRQLDLGG